MHLLGLRKSGWYKISFRLGILLILVACTQMENQQEVQEFIPMGKNSYDNYCKGCHGDDGTLGLMNATNLQTITLDSLSISKVILHGKGNMQGFSGKIHEEEIGNIIQYISELNLKKN